MSELPTFSTRLHPYRSKFITTRFGRMHYVEEDTGRPVLLSDGAFRLLNFPLPILGLMQGEPSSISGDVAKAYAWPLRRVVDRAAPLALARMVPNHPEHPTVAELTEGDAWARSFQGPVELLWGVKDPILGRARPHHRQRFPRARVTETTAGHFLQEEVPEDIIAAIRRVADAR